LAETVYWTYSTINKILNNEIYTGNMVQHKSNRSHYRNTKSNQVNKEEWLIVEGTHEPIIEKSVWLLTQDLLKRDTRVIDFHGNISLFAGFFKCKTCGRAMVKVKRYKTVEYVCGSYKRYGVSICTSHVIHEEILKELVLNDLRDYVGHALEMYKIVESINTKKKSDKKKEGITANIRRLKNELDRVYKLKKVIYEDYRLGELSEKDYLRYKEDYEKQEHSLNSQISVLSGSANDDDKVFETDWIVDFRKHNNITDLDRDILAAFIENIFIDENKTIEIFYKFQSETELLKKVVQ